MSNDKTDNLLVIGSAFDWITPAIQLLRGLNYCVAVGQPAIDGQKILNKARIPCAFDIKGGGCTLSVKKADINRAAQLLR